MEKLDNKIEEVRKELKRDTERIDNNIQKVKKELKSDIQKIEYKDRLLDT